MRSFLLQHVGFFGAVISKWQELFRKCYALVCTTAFDDGFDRTILAPFAHCLNHHHGKSTGLFAINTQLHLDPLLDKSYFDGPKFLTDATVFYANCKDPAIKDKALANDMVRGF